jgi:hypothetical protein
MSPPTDELKNILAPNEQVQLYIRKKFYHSKIMIESVAITNERIILKHATAPGLEKDHTDYNYGDIKDVEVKGVLRSTLRVMLKGGESLLLDDMANSDAQEAYGIIKQNLASENAKLTS